MSRFILKLILYTTLFGVLMATAIFGPPVYLAEPFDNSSPFAEEGINGNETIYWKLEEK